MRSTFCDELAVSGRFLVARGQILVTARTRSWLESIQLAWGTCGARVPRYRRGNRHGTADTFHNSDLTDDVAEMVRRLWWHGLDVIVVDQTTPEHRVGGFCCVKVIIPGALPMTFGHANRRIHGLPRLLEVPRLLGYRDKALLPQDINPIPIRSRDRIARGVCARPG